MVRSKLISCIKDEVEKYIGIPYWMNTVSGGVIVREGIYGGKGNWQQIDEATKNAALLKGIDISRYSQDDLYKFRKKHHIGIDCSGLVYHLLDFVDHCQGNDGILNKVVGTDNRYGVRRVSVKMLTSPVNSTQINNYDDIKTADFIRLNKGKHVLFVIEKLGNIIHYVHSSDRTETRGVHYGRVEIIDTQKTLNFQKWTDITLDGNNYASMVYPEDGDGVYRLNCFF